MAAGLRFEVGCHNVVTKVKFDCHWNSRFPWCCLFDLILSKTACNLIKLRLMQWKTGSEYVVWHFAHSLKINVDDI